MFGVSTLIGLYTQKVVDSIVKSTFCQACASHQDLKNEDIRSKISSEEKQGVKYNRYVGDGDCKTFKAILTAKRYGDDLVVKKKNAWAMWRRG